MIIECGILAFLDECFYFFGEPSDDDNTWQDITKLYTAYEMIDIPDNLVEQIIEEQKICRAPHLYLRYMTGGFKWSQLERINHKKEVEHREAYRARLTASGKYSEKEIENLTRRFHVMVFPEPQLWDNSPSYWPDKEAFDCWNNIKDRLYTEFNGKTYFLGFVQFDGVLKRDEYIPAWTNLCRIALKYSIKDGTQIIGKDAFKLWDIDEVTIPESVERIIGNPFGDSKFYFNYLGIVSHSPKFIVEDGILLEKLDDGTRRLIYCFDKDLTSVSDPLVSIVEEKAFKDCFLLDTVDFPSLRVVKDNAFQNCHSLINKEELCKR